MYQSISLAIILFSADFLLILGDPLVNDILPTHLITALVRALEIGVTINLPGTAIKIGLVTVPFDTLCKTSLTEREICRVCMLDCKFAHNATSGKCGPHPIRLDETTCLCDYSPATQIPTVTSICMSSYSFNFFHSELFNQKIDSAVEKVLRIRFKTVLCSGTLMGCKTDCVRNHGAKTGACKAGYCLCRY